MKTRTVVLLFTLGSLVGVPLAGLYIRFSPSDDKFFHAFVMLAACCVSFPAVVVFLRITLRMWAMAEEQRGAMLELRDSLKPFVEKAGTVVDGAASIIEDLKNQKAGKIVEFIEKIEKDGIVPKIVSSVEGIGKQVAEVIRRATKGRGGPVDVPIIGPEGVPLDLETWGVGFCVKCGASNESTVCKYCGSDVAF